MSLSTLLSRFIQLAVFLLLIMACETEGTTPIPTYSLSTAASPTAGGRITASPSGSTFTEGQSVTLTPEANADWVFSHWEGAASGGTTPLSVTMNANKSVIGIFVKRDYPLNITMEGQGTVNEFIVTNPAGRDYPHGTTVELTPVPAEGWIFDSWGGDLSGSEVPKRITVDGEKNVIAKFKIREYPLTITIEGEGTVTEEVVTNPAGREYPQGTIVELTPVPAEGWIFESWGGDLSGSETPKRITVDGEKNVSAKFKIREYPLTITIEGEGTVTEEVVTNPAGRDYPQGTIVELTPVPAEGWVFESWGGDLSGSETPKRITMDGEKNVTVVFKETSTVLFYLAENGITCKCEGASPEDKGFINGVEYEAVDNELIRKRRDEGVDMTKLCTSLVTDMSRLFYLKRDFNQAIGNWDVINVTNMRQMFAASTFDQPIGKWDVGKVTNMEGMFANTPFNQPIGDWDVTNIANMWGMFANTPFNQPIGDWDVVNVTDMGGMFRDSKFNQPIVNWDVGNVTNMWGMFNGSQFNKPIGNWDVSNVTDMQGMFANTSFNQPIGDWDVAKVTDMAAMFQRSQFNQPIGEWNIGKVENISGMFLESPFNQLIGDWDVSNVKTMWGMFRDSQFNKPLGNWDVSSVINMGEMFSGSPFNQPIENWNVGKVVIMQRMFANSQVNQPIGDWDVSNVVNMVEMFFANSAFNQDLSKWCVNRISTRPFGFRVGTTAWVLPEPVWGTCPE